MAIMFAFVIVSALLVKRGLLESGPTFYGVRLSKRATALLREVERRYEYPIVEGRSINLDPGEVARSGLDFSGAPFIAVAPSVRADESVIVHELFHLKLQTEGYPSNLIWDSSTLPNDDGRYALLERQLLHLCSIR